MLPEERQQFSFLLESLSDALDVPPSRYAEAETHYNAVTKFLGQDDSALAPYDPDLYPQGSFRLGTAIRPVTEHDEYDVDLVCQLQTTREEVLPAELKKMIGARLRESKVYGPMLKEGNRCWTLDYAEGTKFHMDILPGIPDQGGVPHSILITDKDLRTWQHSNPRGYAKWFQKRMEVKFLAAKALLAESMRASVEEIPDYRVRTPLQRAVQLLKRHRDIMFAKDPDNKPASIIISTLAGWAYGDEGDLYEALTQIAANMERHLSEKNGVVWLPNPVDPRENFCDRWRKHPDRRLKFTWWLQRVQQDIENALEGRDKGLPEIGDRLRGSFGERVVDNAFERFGEKFHKDRKSGSLTIMTGAGTLSSGAGRPVPDHTFMGDHAPDD